MKNLLKIMFAGLIAIFLSSCAARTPMAPANVASLLQKREFTFVAERANPSSMDVINVMNSLPTSSSSQMLNLDDGYTLKLTKDKVTAELPYFGRMYTPSFDKDKNSYRFTSRDFTVNESAGKNGSAVYSIQLKDQQNIRRMILEVYKNGKAYLSVDANDRQQISYDGYITNNALVKK